MIDISKLFDESIRESVGCTEPAAIGLATAVAFNAIHGRLPADYRVKRLNLSPGKIGQSIENITVRASRGIFKNALQVGIPYRQGLKGPFNAAALGLFCDPARELELFTDLEEEKAQEAASLLKAEKVAVVPIHEWDNVRIEAEVTAGGKKGIARISGDHSNISYIEVEGKPVFEKPETPGELDKLAGIERVSDFIEIIESGLTPRAKGKKARKRLEKALKTNFKALLSTEELFIKLKRRTFGLAMKDFAAQGDLAGDYVNITREKVSLAVEARMAGFNIKVMTCAGSGNQGLVATLPLIIIAWSEYNRKHPQDRIDWQSTIDLLPERSPGDWEKLVKATGLVYLIANYMSLRTGKLSASCGCDTTTGIGVTAGIAYYLTPESAENRTGIIGQAINHMGGSIIGMICDGGKEGCALKAAVATGVAVESALLACREPDLAYIDGIVNKDAMITLQRISSISRAMAGADRKIIEFLQDTPLPN
ncbi:MAG: L-serine ammonia-lyase, iron-sulfur-dependent, subunit alpha [Dehalococcoidales bacterium]|nr:L-serine ammonia-lyase, iron-sulfur-dependent, subunit alpha [Dehalococcoidales bacterium]